MKQRGNHEKLPNKTWKVMDIALIFIAAFLLVFTAIMVWLFVTQGCIPDTLCTCVFTCLCGECGAMAWIKSSKEKYRERQWQLEDREKEDNTDESSNS